ncbi:MAG: DUF262 domain-containing protein [Anaerolineae bacterium]|nr:DUF262 domain-containing protein [Anaerolineae bacterium]
MIGHPLRVKEIISELERGGIRIPEIQRGYVWKRSQIAQLLDSLYRGFPTGSILIWDTLGDVQMREIATGLGRNARSDFASKIILDGQQRITSLGRVFDPATPKQDRILFNVETEVFEPYSPRHTGDPRWIDTTEFFTSSVTEMEIVEKLEEVGVITDKEFRKEIFNRLKKLDMIREYQYPVEIIREDDLEVVTEVFIRVNSGGTRLREAELALARLAWKLPGSIVGPFTNLEEYCEERGFDGIDARFLMRELISVATRQSRFRDLKTFWSRPAAEIEAAWERTEQGLRNALDFVQGNVGIPGSVLLPSHVSLIPLTVIFSVRHSLTADEIRTLRRWFLTANCFSRYVGATETILNQDLSVLGEDAENIVGLMNQLLRDLRAEPRVMPSDLERAGMNSPFFPLAYLAVIRRDAEDWFKGIKLRRNPFSEDQQIEYHHIFPKRHLNACNVDQYARDEMANIAFLSQKANRKILTREPAEYLAQIAESAPHRLEAQFVPMDRSLWRLDRYEAFLAARRELLANAMNEELKG